MSHKDSNTAQTAYGADVSGTDVQTSQLCQSATYGLGYPSLSTDEAGKRREVWTDALGRIIEVDEPDPSSGSLTLNTCAKYDVLNNLTQVVQGSQRRTYFYDMLSRLTQATTPESGTMHFCYTSSTQACVTPDTGNTICSGDPSAVCRRTDARSVTTTYSYDNLNRLKSKWCDDTPRTPAANFFYDQAP